MWLFGICHEYVVHVFDTKFKMYASNQKNNILVKLDNIVESVDLGLRCFKPKVVPMWRGSSDIQHLGLPGHDSIDQCRCGKGRFQVQSRSGMPLLEVFGNFGSFFVLELPQKRIWVCIGFASSCPTTVFWGGWGYWVLVDSILLEKQPVAANVPASWCHGDQNRSCILHYFC